MKDLLRIFNPAGRCLPLAESGGRHLEHYRHFRDFLLANRQALRQLATLEMLHYGNRAFTTADIAFHYETLAGEVHRLVRSLNQLADHRFAQLEDKLRDIEARIAPLLRTRAATSEVAPVLSLRAAAEVDEQDVGGKAGHLATIAAGGTLPIPVGFVVTATGYHQFLRANGLDQLVLDELATLAPNDPRLYEVSARLGELILAAEVPPGLAELIHSHYQRLCEEHGGEMLLAVRSSAVREDSQASFAGQYRSLLNVPKSGLLHAYKEVVASSFSPQVINYRRANAIEISETPMCVLFLEMVEAEISGVLYTVDPSGQDASTLLIEAVAGLGEALVDGSVLADRYLCDKSTGRLKERHLSPHLGETPEKRELDHQELSRLLEAGLALERSFAGPQDIEWAIDTERRLFLLQCRPLHVDDQPQEILAPPENQALTREGEVASSGVAAGPVFIFREGHRPADIPEGAVVVARTASPRLAEAMERVAALITEVGSSMCHLASVAREMGVPMAVNVLNAARLLAAQPTVTVYAGKDFALYPGVLTTPETGKRGLRRRLAAGPMQQKLRAVLDHLSPLHLTDPGSPEFTPENCASLHDIIRFAHEQAVREMFALSALAEERAAVRLSSHLPLELHLLDLGGGLAEGLTTCDKVGPEHFHSQPLQALWRGFCHPGINWSGTMQVDKSGFLARLAAPATAEFGPEPGGASYALIAADYLNFSIKFGYHYATLDTLCSEDADHNYLSLQFSGGAGSYYGKTLRLQFLGRILTDLGCSLEVQGDLLEAGLSRLPAGELLDKLDHLGRLLACSRLLDMVIANQEDVDRLAEEFLQGNYDLLGYSATRQKLPGFHTHLGNWRLTEDQGTPCWLADGSRWLNPLASSLSGAMGKILGKAYQEMLDSIGLFHYFPLAVAKDGPFDGTTIALDIKALAGRIDQAGGLVLAIRDIGNYLVLRLNVLEQNLILFEFVDNRRVARASTAVTLSLDTWYTLEVRLERQRVCCFLDREERFAYFPERSPSGYVGLWSKADSVVLFKGLRFDGRSLS